jgi:hypothetical protein
MLGPKCFFGCMEGLYWNLNMCGEKLRVKTFPIYSRPIWQKVLIIQSCVARQQRRKWKFYKHSVEYLRETFCIERDEVSIVFIWHNFSMMMMTTTMIVVCIWLVCIVFVVCVIKKVQSSWGGSGLLVVLFLVAIDEECFVCQITILKVMCSWTWHCKEAQVKKTTRLVI